MHRLNKEIPGSVAVDELGIGAKFVIAEVGDQVSFVLFQNGLQHIDMASRLIASLGEQAKFVGAGMIINQRTGEVEYDSSSCRKGEYKRDCPIDPKEAAEHLEVLGKLLRKELVLS